MADDGYPQYDDQYVASQICRVYSNEDTFTAFVQGLLAFVALMSLWFKRMREIPQRSFQTWFLDVSKQGVGAVYGHVANMVVSAMIVSNIRGDAQLDDECAWYAILYLIDTVFGLILALAFLHLLDVWAEKKNWTSLKNSGLYEGPDAIRTWTHQVIAWIVVLTLVKIIICFFMWAFSSFFAVWGAILFGPLESNIKFELLFVMIVFPGLLNVIYFWVTDHFLKHNPPSQDANTLESDYNVMGEAAGGEISGRIANTGNSDVKGYIGNYAAPSVPISTAGNQRQLLNDDRTVELTEQKTSPIV